jgi:hypothetical protein
MKKLFCFVMVLFLTFPVFSCASSSLIDPLPSFYRLASLNIDDLLRCKDFIFDELDRRGYTEISLTDGKHNVGEDIPSGKYVIKFEDNPGAYKSAVLLVDTSEGERVAFVSAEYNSYSHVTYNSRDYDLPTVELSDGQIMTIIGDSPLIFYTYDGI